MTMQSYHFKLI